MKRYSVPILVLALVSFGLIFSGFSLAGEDSVYRKINEQQKLINKAVQDGSLSRTDAETMRANLKKIQDKLEKYVDQGRLTHDHEKKLKERLEENMERFNNMTQVDPKQKFDH
ncbi:MAG: hypothetical protein LLG06_13385 [Desulfobacteraceae bacterium]|nr:hypothetical protein [Desulfobacteraceae bacterium]